MELVFVSSKNVAFPSAALITDGTMKMAGWPRAANSRVRLRSGSTKKALPSSPAMQSPSTTNPAANAPAKRSARCDATHAAPSASAVGAASDLNVQSRGCRSRSRISGAIPIPQPRSINHRVQRRGSCEAHSPRVWLCFDLCMGTCEFIAHNTNYDDSDDDDDEAGGGAGPLAHTLLRLLIKLSLGRKKSA